MESLNRCYVEVWTATVACVWKKISIEVGGAVLRGRVTNLVGITRIGIIEYTK